ncbi:MAG: DUF4878 domain-containing protein [Neisseriaceae bacterium]|nr:DUF4878 domain-containing protein [Neisseriaceae bacterium]
MRAFFHKTLSFFSIVLLALAMTACSAGGTPEKVAEKFISSMYQGDVDTVLSLIHFPEEEKNKPGTENMLRGKLQMMVAEAQEKSSEMGGIQSIKAESVEYSDNNAQARVQVKVVFKKDNKEINDSIRLVKDGNQWKVRL